MAEVARLMRLTQDKIGAPEGGAGGIFVIIFVTHTITEIVT
jgi:hypothetical protein